MRRQRNMIGRLNEARLTTKIREVIAFLFIITGTAMLFNTADRIQSGRLNNIYDQIFIEAGSDSAEADLFLKKADGAPITYITDISGISFDVPAAHQVKFLWHDRQYESTLRIRDTVPPTGETKDITVIGAVLPAPEEFVTKADDLSGPVLISYKTEPDVSVSGDEEVTLALTDAYGNTTYLPAVLTVIIDTEPPVIEGVKSRTVYIGGSVSYREGVTVTDDMDDSPSLEIDAGEVDFNKAGTYTVTYTATDWFGNKTVKEAKVHVIKRPVYVPPKPVDADMIDAAADALLAQIVTPGMSARAQATAIYNWAKYKIGYVSYPQFSNYRQEAYHVIKHRRGDCYSHYSVCRLLFDRLGFPSLLVTRVRNYAGDYEHYWNMVSLDGGATYYHFDSTPRQNGGDFCLVTDAYLDAYSAAHGECFRRDKSLYPPTPGA